MKKAVFKDLFWPFSSTLKCHLMIKSNQEPLLNSNSIYDIILHHLFISFYLNCTKLFVTINIDGFVKLILSQKVRYLVCGKFPQTLDYKIVSAIRSKLVAKLKIRKITNIQFTKVKNLFLRI